MDRIALADHAFDKHSGIDPSHSVMRLCHVEQDAQLRLAGLGVDRDYLAARVTLEVDIRTFINLHNKNPKPFKWTKSADQILASVKRFCHKAQQTLCGEL